MKKNHNFSGEINKRNLVEEVKFLLRLLGIYESDYVQEFKFLDNKNFRFDFMFPTEKLAVEVEGGIWVNGRHVRPETYSRDCVKYSWASLMGWRLIRITDIMLDNGEALKLLEYALNRRAGD